MANAKVGRVETLQARVSKFSRVEKAFYGSIILTALIMAVSVIFMQTKLLQIQHNLTTVNNQIETKQTELDDAKQEVNELTRRNRLAEVASSQKMTIQDKNVVVVGKP